MSWRVAKSLNVLLNQLNTKFPSRRKDSDGSIGDLSHQERSSDHNAWLRYNDENIVTARDYTHDPQHGMDTYLLAETLRQHKDERIKYVISKGRIFAGPEGPSPFTWRSYHGTNPHDHHMHLSVRGEVNGKPAPQYFDSTALWTIGGVVIPQPQPSGYRPPPPTLKLGSKGPDVKLMQKALNLKDDGQFGPITQEAVILVQKKAGLIADGIVGPQTWKVIAPLVKVA